MARILVIDDDSSVRRSIELILRNAGFIVQTAATGEAGLDLALAGLYDVILSDIRMPGISGLEVLRRLRERGVDTTMIMMTGFGTIEMAVEAMRLGAIDFVQKPFLHNELVLRVKSAAERRQLARQVKLLQRHVQAPGSLAAIIGTSDAVGRVRAFVRRAAAAAGTVLITGETGTGKELVARAVHAESPRAAHPFVAVNCAALTESLLENELFGHARGAFTGAEGARAGLIEHAHGGTLFLDEIGAMPKAVQAKLLRVLESGEIRRIGENDTRQVDVRFVAATNVNLKAVVAAGEFREDLFYRLNVLPVHLSPLRERGDDIVVLADHFLGRYGRPAGVLGMTDEVREILGRYSFPGNVRQLEHIIQRAVAVAQGPVLELADLPEEVLEQPSAPLPSEGTVAAARSRAEREMIVAAIARHAGDLSGAARELQVSRTTLWRLMRKHEIASESAP